MRTAFAYHLIRLALWTGWKTPVVEVPSAASTPIPKAYAYEHRDDRHVFFDKTPSVPGYTSRPLFLSPEDQIAEDKLQARIDYIRRTTPDPHCGNCKGTGIQPDGWGCASCTPERMNDQFVDNSRSANR